MRRLAVTLAALALLSACAPALSPAIQRQGDSEAVTVTIVSARAVYGVTLTVQNASTTDERCDVIDDALSCVLGDLAAGETARVLVVGPFGIGCTAAGFLVPDSFDLRHYRPFTCRARPNTL